MRVRTKNHLVEVNVASWKDPSWWLKDDHGFKVTYLLSAHIHTNTEYPGIKALHLVAGPLRFVSVWRSVKATGLGPLYASFALQLVNMQDQFTRGMFGWAAVSLFMFGWTTKLIAQEYQKRES